METSTLVILMACALVVLAVTVGVLMLRLFHKNNELREKNDAIIREMQRNLVLIDRAVQQGVKRAALFSTMLAVVLVMA